MLGKTGQSAAWNHVNEYTSRFTDIILSATDINIVRDVPAKRFYINSDATFIFHENDSYNPTKIYGISEIIRNIEI